MSLASITRYIDQTRSFAIEIIADLLSLLPRPDGHRSEIFTVDEAVQTDFTTAKNVGHRPPKRQNSMSVIEQESEDEDEDEEDKAKQTANSITDPDRAKLQTYVYIFVYIYLCRISGGLSKRRRG